MNIEVATPADLESRRSLARYTKYCSLAYGALCERKFVNNGNPWQHL